MNEYRLMLGFPNRMDRAVVSGGSWAPTLPLANIQTRLLARVARTVNLQPQSATMVFDFGRPEFVDLLALIAHNATLQAMMRIEASSSADFSTHLYDETTDVWGGLLTAGWDIDQLEWESDNYWLGTFTQEDIEGLTATSTHILPASVAARYWRITLIDPRNPAGYLEVGRVFIGPALRPSINYAWGATVGYESLTEVVTALGGAEFFDIREPVRVFRFTLQYLRDDEAYGRFLEMTRKAGLHGEIFVVPDPTDSYYGLLRNFLGRMRQPSVLEQAMWANGGSAHNMSFEIKELR